MAREFADGIVFGLPEDLYRADPALGSTDHKTLAVNPEAYWYGSRLNPARPEDKDTEARAMGRAVHAAALEGDAAFKSRFVPRPDWVQRMDAKSKVLVAPRGETILPREKYDRAALAAAMIRAHPDLANSLSDGFPEVSVFWTVDVDGAPVRCKARFDYLKARAIVDLKSIAPKKPLPFKALCIRDIRSYRYGVQAAAYLEARALVGDFIENGQMEFFGEEPDISWMTRLASAPDFAFVWLFWASEGPPLVWSAAVSPGNPLLEDGKSIVTQARRNFVAYRERFGTDTAWLDFEPLAELTLEDFETAYGRHF